MKVFRVTLVVCVLTACLGMVGPTPCGAQTLTFQQVGPSTVCSSAGTTCFPLAARDMAVGDFNEDGFPDVAVVEDANNVHILLGDGSGEFVPSASFIPQHFTGTFTDIQVSDVDLDSYPDVLVSALAPTGIYIFHGGGDGTIDPAQFVSHPSSPERMVVADLNEDGIPDLVTMDGLDNDLYYAFGTGALSYSFQALGSNLYLWMAASVADITGDQHVDLIAAHPASSFSGLDYLAVFPGDGTGVFDVGSQAILVNVDIPNGATPTTVVAADFNEDGLLDLATSDTYPPVGQIVIVDSLDGTNFDAPQTYVSGYPPSALVSGDFDNDGHLDLAALAWQTGEISLYRGLGNGDFQIETSYPTETQTTELMVADVNQDGVSDLVYASAGFDPGIYSLLSTGFVQPGEFRRGDANTDGSSDIADAITVLGYLFPPGGNPIPLLCRDAADANDDGAIDLGDAVSILNSLFANPVVPLPPPVNSCGLDPTADGQDCQQYSACP